MYKLFFVTECLPKSLNKKLRSHFHKNNSENKKWDYLVNKILIQKQMPKEPLLRAKISVVRHSHRMLDYDGLVGSLKPVIDALVSCEVLSDDSWSVTGPWDCTQRFRPKKDGPKLEIMIQEMPVRE